MSRQFIRENRYLIAFLVVMYIIMANTIKIGSGWFSNSTIIINGRKITMTDLESDKNVTLSNFLVAPVKFVVGGVIGLIVGFCGLVIGLLATLSGILISLIVVGSIVAVPIILIVMIVS